MATSVRSRGSRVLILAGAALALLSAIGTLLFLHAYWSVLNESFQDKSAAYATAFAAAARAWLADEETETARSAARFLLLGSALYVQVAWDGDVVVDERAPGLAGLPALPPLDGLASPEVFSRERAPGIPAHLDLIVVDHTGRGYTRVGMDLSPVALRGRSAGLIAAGTAALFDLLFLTALALLVRRRGAPGQAGDSAEVARLQEGASQDGSPALRVDEERKEVWLRGGPISLTPKQYALLRLLASAPGRVFSDREIVAAVWPESSYADSKDVKQCVYLLRRRLGEVDAAAAEVVQNVPGFGYRLLAPDDRDLTGG